MFSSFTLIKTPNFLIEQTSEVYVFYGVGGLPSYKIRTCDHSSLSSILFLSLSCVGPLNVSMGFSLLRMSLCDRGVLEGEVWIEIR